VDSKLHSSSFNQFPEIIQAIHEVLFPIFSDFVMLILDVLWSLNNVWTTNTLKKDFQKLSCNQKGIKRISGLLVLEEQQHTLPEYVDALY
jgi:hypothetical protein